MKYIECEVNDKEAYVIPIGDTHIGDRGFNKESRAKLIGYLKWAKERPNARVFLNGDIFNCASRISKTSPFEIDHLEGSELEQAIEIFEPYKDIIIGATDGNHEARMLDMFDVSMLQVLCLKLGIPYCKWSAVVRLKLNKSPSGRWSQNYFLYFHHTTGGGGTIGGKMNRVTKLRDIVEGMDVYFGNHNHQLAAAPQDVYYPSMQGGVKRRRIWYVDCGSYLQWENSYAEKGMLAPTKLGSPKVIFDGQENHHDVHVSI
jgi:hypothetical protein